jgi:hypothetical protein
LLLPPSGVRQVGQWGNGALEFWCPSGLAITRNNEHLIVVDSWNHRLQVKINKNHFQQNHRFFKIDVNN